MNQATSCIAERISIQINNGSDCLQELLDANNAQYLEMEGATKFLFPDNSILIIDDEGNSTFVNLKKDKQEYQQTFSKTEKSPDAEKKQSLLDKIKNSKMVIGLTLGGILISGAAVAGAAYFYKN